MHKLIRQAWAIPLAGVVIALLVLGGSLFTASEQWRAASLIDASPLRVDATISAALPRKGDEGYTVAYRVGDRDYSTKSLNLKRIPNPGPGVTVPLEVAQSDPATARVAGEHYPDEDTPSTCLLAAVAATAGLLVSLRFLVVRVRRTGGTGGTGAAEVAVALTGRA
ncbi:hypothetical protein OG455_22570 [Kitasatospora sp. NBC_01287]|uniref:hypothetical protein n=1 Tax=Kitasatospora sp. NBC_01287 TaxID=2903573 RepID=UPI002255F888|nr:hypothetical protein [Kitasatospora sp. NBC_01287]MCX4748264.1 hypothetical protein [Kitasatospora sp. NBC_01287]